MEEYVKRERYLQRLIERRDNGDVKIITGPRRSGKSFLLKTIYRDYLENPNEIDPRIPTETDPLFEPEISRCSHPLPLHIDSVPAQVVFLSLERSLQFDAVPKYSIIAGVEFYCILQSPSGRGP